MHVSRTPKTALHTKRIDPDYYAPKHLADDRVLHGVGAIELGCTGRLFSGPFGSEVPNSVFVEHGVPLLRVGNVGEMQVDANDLARIPAELHRQLGASEVIPGDLLIVKASVGEKLSLVPDDMERANITQHIIGLRPNGSVDMGFAAAALFSSYGKRQLQRRALGAIIQYLGIHEARTVLIPRLKPDAQRYIGSKVRQAEVLREWARALEKAFTSAVAINVPDATGRGRQSRVSPSDLDPDLNPGRFTPDRLEVRRALKAYGARSMVDMATILTENNVNVSATSRYLGLDGISQTSVDLTFQTVANAGIDGTCRILRPGAAISKLRPYLNKAALIPGDLGPLVGSTEVLCVASETVHPGFIYGVLKLDTTLRQLNPVASGATHPRVGTDDVLDVLVPWNDDHEALGRSLERAQKAYFGARSLVTAARLLVEALIERKVTEAELITASKDPAADRALLSRLAEDGLDGSGRALFSDLDALQALLTEATERS